MLDAMSNAGRTVEPEPRGTTNGSVNVGGRRKFGDACLAGEQAVSRAATPHFLSHGPDGIVTCQILLLPGFELNELSALTEVFDCANRMLCEAQFNWHLASLDGAAVCSAGGLPVAVARAAQASEHRHLFVLSAYGAPDPAQPGLSALLFGRYAVGTRIAGIGGACALLAEAG